MTRIWRGRAKRRQGAALLFVVAISGALILLLLGFSITTRLERRAQQNHSDHERARMVAWSGVERAKFELRRAVRTPGYSVRWLEYVEPAGPPVPFGDPAARPSFRMRFDPVPRVLDEANNEDVEITIPWPSGVMGNTYYQDPVNPEFLGDYYVLRVTDTNAKLFLNDSNVHLPRMLETLARSVGMIDAQGVAQAILAARPVDGYRGLEELRGVISDDDLRALAPLLTCEAWVDHKVIEMGMSEVLGAAPSETVGFEGGESQYLGEPASLELTRRAPVNINLAPRPLLVSVFYGIGFGGQPGQPEVKVSYQQAEELADAVLAFREGSLQTARYGFTKWGQFYAFLNRINPQLSVPMSDELISAILANCNPNTDLNKFVPDLSIYRPIDKSDLTGATTEFTLGFSGMFTIESLGVILDADAVPVTTVPVSATVRIFERYVERHQADFEVDRADEAGPGELLPGLRDMVSLPEFRNDGSAAGRELGALAAASYDGQMAFNVATRTTVSGRGSYVSFLGQNLDGWDLEDDEVMRSVAEGGQGAAGSAGMSVLGGSVATPNWQGGSDLYPLGARLGERYLAYAQEDVTALNHLEFPDMSQMSPFVFEVTDGHNPTKLTVPYGDGIPGQAWDMDLVDAQAFEMWFKPDFKGPQRQALMSWRSGGPQPVIEYQTARGGFSLPGGGEAVGALATLETGAQVEMVIWMQEEISAEVDGISAQYRLYADFSAVTLSETAIPGKQIPSPLSEFEPRYTNSHNPLPTTLLMRWTGPLVRPGTWHHVMLSFFVDARNAARLDGEEEQAAERVGFFVDGRKVEPNLVQLDGQDFRPSLQKPLPWVREVSPFLRAILWGAGESRLRMAPIREAVIQNVLPLLQDPDLGSYPAPVFPGDDVDPLMVGRPSPFLTALGQLRSLEPFQGLVDNLVFQGNYPKWFLPPPVAGPPLRFDQWRPSLGRDTEQEDDHHLSFHKRTTALEFDVPITLLGYDWTAWKHNDQKGGLLDLGLV